MTTPETLICLWLGITGALLVLCYTFGAPMPTDDD